MELQWEIDGRADTYSRAELRREFERIARENMQHLYACGAMLTGSRHDGEDAAEEAIYRLFCRTVPFNDDNHARAWLIRVTINAALKMQRRRKFLADKPIEEQEEQGVDFEYPEQSEVYAAVKSLPPKYRTVIILRYYEDMDTNEIARLLKIPRSTVTTRLSRGRDRLRELLKGERYEF